jgi:hypothetical protein
MADNPIIWHASRAETEKIIQLIDLLEQARDTIKLYPDTSLDIAMNPEDRTLTFSIHEDWSRDKVIPNHDLGDKTISRSKSIVLNF